MQKFIAIGNLTKDPEHGKTNNGTVYCKFSVAIPRDFKDANGDRQVDFFNCTAWRGLAENIYKYCVKGSKVCIVGQVQNRSYESNGRKQTVTEIKVENVEFLTRRSEENANKEERLSTEELDKRIEQLTPIDDDDMPF